MAASLFISKSWQAPFFGKSSAYVGGRDPLGLQTTSGATYSRLLPGITNVTNRVRYWSFYCWLIHLYSKKIHRTGQARFIDFIRRGEFALAVAVEIVSPEESAVSGKNQAKKAVQELPLDLKKYADNDAQPSFKYWKYETGAFGQYFSGVLTELGLLERNEQDIFICTDKSQNERFAENLEVSGIELAAAFAQSIGSELENRFFNALEKGIVLAADLQDFGEKMNFSAVEPATDEWLLIQKILTGRDLPGRNLKDSDTFFRHQTISLFLEFRRREKERSVVDFRFWVEQRGGLDIENTETDVAFGWFFYAINEHWHHACEQIFNAFLEKLRLDDFAQLETFISQFSTEIAHFSTQNEANFTLKNWANGLPELPENDRRPIAEAVRGFLSILDLYEKYAERLDHFIHFGQRLGIERRGDFGHGLRLVSEQLYQKPEAFFEWFLLRQIINRHLFVAIEKLATTGVNTQKFRLEERVLYFINNIGVGYTNPRLNQLAMFLRDLKVLDHEFFPTELAANFLENQTQKQP